MNYLKTRLAMIPLFLLTVLIILALVGCNPAEKRVEGLLPVDYNLLNLCLASNIEFMVCLDMSQGLSE